MRLHSALAAASVLTALCAFPTTGLAQQWANNATHIYNTNSGRVGIGLLNPAAKLHVVGNGTFAGDLFLPKTNHSLIFGTTAGPTTDPMILQFKDGTTNPDRMVLAHSPSFPTWGLQYQDSGDRYRFLRSGTPVVTIDLGGDLLTVECDQQFISDQDGITFSTADSSNQAMITMFPSGTGNGDRMVLSHSPGFTNWGLQYRDSPDEFRFLTNGSTVMNVDLGSTAVSINSETSSPSAALQVGDAGDGEGIITNSYSVFSSRKFKKDIESMSDEDCTAMLDEMVSTPVYKYRYKGESADIHHHVGVMVEESPKDILSPNNISVDLSRYVGTLHAALKAQQAQIEALQQQVQSLAGEN